MIDGEMENLLGKLLIVLIILCIALGVLVLSFGCYGLTKMILGGGY